MSKPPAPRRLADTEAQAIVSNLRVSPRKLNLVAAMIRNLPAQRAVAAKAWTGRLRGRKRAGKKNVCAHWRELRAGRG